MPCAFISDSSSKLPPPRPLEPPKAKNPPETRLAIIFRSEELSVDPTIPVGGFVLFDPHAKHLSSHKPDGGSSIAIESQLNVCSKGP
jgi:hypothetical protein